VVPQHFLLVTKGWHLVFILLDMSDVQPTHVQSLSRKPHRCCLLNLSRYIFSFCLHANLANISSRFIIVRFPIGNICKPKLSHCNKGGDNSGASQPHKHIQFIPSEDKDGPPLEKLARKVQIQFPGSSTNDTNFVAKTLSWIRSTVFTHPIVICQSFLSSPFRHSYILAV